MTPDEITAIERDGVARLEGAATLDELRQAEADVLGRKSAIAGVSAKLGALDAEQRKTVGQLVNAARGRLQDAAQARREKLEEVARQQRLETERLDLTEVLPGPPIGHLSLVTQTRDELEDVFVGMGYVVAEGPEVESDWYNFEALNMPPAHPARSMWDTVYIRLGAPESTLLRTHTSPVQIRLMEAQRPPIYAVMPGACYRRETQDARHLASFRQIEGLVVDRNVTFGDLAGTIETFTSAYFGPNIHSRLRPSYFPFTEPSAEFEVTCAICEGAGCRTCSDTGWIELGGCGLVHPNVLKAVDIDPEEWSGFAFGFGIERCAQMRHGIDDMRVILDNDIRFLQQF